MFGTIIAAFIWAYNVIFGGLTPAMAIKNVLPFLWIWHWIFAGIIGLIVVCLIICALIGTFAAQTKTGKVGSFIGFLSSPIWACLFFIGSALYLSGVWLVDHALVVCNNTITVQNQNYLIVGCVLYGLALLMSIGSRSSTTKAK